MKRKTAPKIDIGSSCIIFGFWEIDALVTKYICKLRGGSQPILAKARDGLRYVVKFTNNLQGSNVPFNESMGSELYRGCGLRVPPWRPLKVTSSFIDRNPDCWIQTAEGAVRPNSGLCFSSQFLGDAGKSLYEILPSVSFQRVRHPEGFWLAWLIDACAGHTDNRQTIFEAETNHSLNVYFIDHGNLFNGPNGDQKVNFQTSRYLDLRAYQPLSSLQLRRVQETTSDLDIGRLWRQMTELPADWKTDSAIKSFTQCLHRLATRSLIQNVLNTMADYQEKAIAYERRKLEGVLELTRSVLRPRVLRAAVQQECRNSPLRV